MRMLLIAYAVTIGSVLAWAYLSSGHSIKKMNWKAVGMVLTFIIVCSGLIAIFWHTVKILFLTLLGAWWFLLAVLSVQNYLRRRKEAKAKKPLTPEDLKRLDEWNEEIRRFAPPGPRWAGIVWMIPWVLFLLPFFVIHWTLGDPYNEQSKSIRS